MHNTTGGSYPNYKSEESYRRNGHLLAAVQPLNGGACDATGTWLQTDERTKEAWPVGLKVWAQDQGQLYMPTVRVNSAANFQTVLDSATLQQTAIDNLMLLVNGTTTTGRFDSPWDGVDLDLEGLNISYKTLLSGWISDLADALHAVDKYLCVTPTGVENDVAGAMAANLYVHDYAVLGEKADYVTPMCYLHGAMTPNIPGPYDWVEKVVQYALGKGIAASSLYMGLMTLCQYNDGAANNEVTYIQAQSILAGASETEAWYSQNAAKDYYRWKYAEWDSESMWMIDYDVWRIHLEIADRHGIGGVCMFLPGTATYGEDDSIWRAIKEWQARPIWSGYSAARGRCDIRADVLNRFTRYRKIRVKSGTTTTIVSDDLFEPDDYWNKAMLYILRDAGNVGAWPEGQMRIVTDYVQSTHTLTVDHAFDNVAAIDYPNEGDDVELYTSSIPVREINRMIDEAVKMASPYWFTIVWDTTTLDFAARTFTYTLPTGIGVLRGVFTRSTSSDKWMPYHNWTVQGKPGAYTLVTSGDAGSGDIALVYEAPLGWNTVPVTDASYLNILDSPSTKDHEFEHWAREYIVNVVLEKMNVRMMNEGDDAHANRRWNLARLHKQEHERIARDHAMPKPHGQLTRQGWMEHDYAMRNRMYTRLQRGGTEPGT